MAKKKEETKAPKKKAFTTLQDVARAKEKRKKMLDEAAGMSSKKKTKTKTKKA